MNNLRNLQPRSPREWALAVGIGVVCLVVVFWALPFIMQILSWVLGLAIVAALGAGAYIVLRSRMPKAGESPEVIDAGTTARVTSAAKPTAKPESTQAAPSSKRYVVGETDVTDEVAAIHARLSKLDAEMNAIMDDQANDVNGDQRAARG
jgi:hypothetical protein